MAFERDWVSVPPQLLTANGGTLGQVQVADSTGFKVKQRVVLSATGLPDLQVEVKRVLSLTNILVGYLSSRMNDYQNVSAYTTSLGAFVYATEQPKAKVVQDDRYYATYDGEPTNAWRNILVDELGDYWGSANPLPVSISGSFAVTTRRLTAADNDPLSGDIHDSIRVSNGTNDLGVNNDGSINVNVVNSVVSNKALINTYAEVNSVATNNLTNLVSYTVPGGKRAILEKISVSGENIAKFSVLINTTAIDTRRTFFGNLNTFFDFSSPDNFGMELNSGDVIQVTVIHQRPDLASFEGRIQVVEIS